MSPTFVGSLGSFCTQPAVDGPSLLLLSLPLCLLVQIRVEVFVFPLGPVQGTQQTGTLELAVQCGYIIGSVVICVLQNSIYIILSILYNISHAWYMHIHS